MKKLLMLELKSKKYILIGILIFILLASFFGTFRGLVGSDGPSNKMKVALIYPNIINIFAITIIGKLLYIFGVIDFTNSLNKESYGILPVHRGKIYLAKILSNSLGYLLIYSLFFSITIFFSVVNGETSMADLSILGSYRMVLLFSLGFIINLITSFNYIVLILFLFNRDNNSGVNKNLVGFFVIIFRETISDGIRFGVSQLGYLTRPICSLGDRMFYRIGDLSALEGMENFTYINTGTNTYINLLSLVILGGLIITLSVFAYGQMEKTVEIGS